MQVPQAEWLAKGRWGTHHPVGLKGRISYGHGGEACL